MPRYHLSMLRMYLTPRGHRSATGKLRIYGPFRLECIRTPENTSSTTFVNKDKKKGRADWGSGPVPLESVAYLAPTFQLRLAGVGSVLPAASVAFTAKVWVPLASLPYVLLVAVPFASQLPPSNLVWKVAFEGSVEEKVNVASLLLTVPEGPESMVVSGGAVSGGGAVPAIVVKDQLLSEASGLPARSLTPLVPPFTVAV